MRKQRLLELDALRGLAALAVMCFHYFYRYNAIYGHENIPVNWSQKGSLGVQLFFMISGFVIFWTLIRVEKPLDFVVSRFSRLYPVYWSAVILTFTVVLCFGLPGREVSYSDAVANVLMFQQYLRVPHVDGVYWTLTVELTFYFLIFILYLINSLKNIESIFLLLISVSVLHSIGVITIPSPIYKILIMKYLPFFIAGISFYKIINDENVKVSVGVLILSLISTFFIYSLNNFLIFILFYVVFYLAVSGRMRFLSVKPLVFLGSISYPLYLLHQNIGYIIINKFYELQLNPVAGVFCSFILSLFLAILLSKYVGDPSLEFIRNRYKHNKKMQLIAEKLMLSGNR